jgi:hypothetical protein
MQRYSNKIACMHTGGIRDITGGGGHMQCLSAYILYWRYQRHHRRRRTHAVSVCIHTILEVSETSQEEEDTCSVCLHTYSRYANVSARREA